MYSKDQNGSAGKTLAWAAAIRDFFDVTLRDGSASLHEVVYGVSQLYDIGPEQRAELDSIAGRALQARAVMEKSREKYGLNQRGCFIRKHELYRDVFDKDPSKEHFSVRPLTIAINFYLPQSCCNDNFLGRCYNTESQVLWRMLDRNTRSMNGNLNSLIKLSFSVNYESVKRDRETTLEIVERHETKHLIDTLVGLGTTPEDERLFSEMSAILFESGFEHFARITADDFEHAKKRLDNRKRYVTWLRSRGAVEETLRSEERKIKTLEKDMSVVDAFPPEILERLYQMDVGQRTLSYIVSTTDPYKLAETLETLHGHLHRRGAGSYARN